MDPLHSDGMDKAQKAEKLPYLLILQNMLKNTMKACSACYSLDDLFL